MRKPAGQDLCFRRRPARKPYRRLTLCRDTKIYNGVTPKRDVSKTVYLRSRKKQSKSALSRQAQGFMPAANLDGKGDHSIAVCLSAGNLSRQNNKAKSPTRIKSMLVPRRFRKYMKMNKKQPSRPRCTSSQKGG